MDKMKQKKWIDQSVSGVITVEMTYVMAVILFVFFLCVLGIFYYHDKEILSSCAYETVTVAATKMREKDEVDEGLVQDIFDDRVNGKCILFAHIDATASVSEDEITVVASASKRKMKVSVSETAVITDPEKKIRDRRRWMGWN